MLVVLVIVGVILSFATLSTSTQTDTQTGQEARRLTALIELASREAILQSKELAVSFSKHGYAFHGFEQNDWKLLEMDEVLRPRELPSDMQLNISNEGVPVVLGSKPEKNTTRILLLSSGEMTPFELTLRSEGASRYYVLAGHSNGELVLEERIDNY